MKKFIKAIIATVIGTLLFFVLGRYVSIPSPIPDTNISIQYGVLAFVAMFFGPVPGVVTGLCGHFLIDFAGFVEDGTNIWWSWIAASAFFGLVMGFATMKLNAEEEGFQKKQIIWFNVSQILTHLLSWMVVAPVLDILVYDLSANETFLEGAFCACTNSVATAVVGSLLCVAYGASKAEPGE